MAISLQNSWNVPPARWGSFADVQYAIRINSEKIYNVNPDTNILAMPLFWGFPLLDYSGGKNHGTNYGAVYKDSSLYFNGSNYVNVDGIPTIPFSVSAWVNPSLIQGEAIWSTADSSTTNNRHILVIDSITGNRFAAITTDPAHTSFTTYGAHSSIAAKKGALCHVVGVWEATNNRKIYVNGVYEDVNTNAVNPTSIDRTWVGRLSDSTPNWHLYGYMPEIHVSNVTYTTEQISLFHSLPYGLYQKVARPFHLSPITAAGWTGKINSITNPGKINGVAVADITKVMRQ